jgi:hypothetical protein
LIRGYSAAPVTPAVLLRLAPAVLALAVAAEARAEGPAAALLPIVAPDLLEPQKRQIADRIRATAADDGLVLQSAADTASGIEQARKAGAACNAESLACQAQLGVLLGVKEVLVARVASDWTGDRLELRLLDAVRGQTVRETTQALPKDGARRDRVLEGAILRVIAPARTGAILVDVPPGASLQVDGVAVVVNDPPLTLEGLAPGEHELELGKVGDVKKRVVVTAGQTSRVSLMTGETGPDQPEPKPAEEAALWPWLLGGGAAVAALAGGAAGGLQAALEYSAMERGQRAALQVTGIGLLGATAAGVVVAGVGGVLFALEDGQ